jgi:hypothetical protein
MRHFLSDWNDWTIAERIAAVGLALAALMIPAAFATVV